MCITPRHYNATLQYASLHDTITRHYSTHDGTILQLHNTVRITARHCNTALQHTAQHNTTTPHYSTQHSTILQHRTTTRTTGSHCNTTLQHAPRCHITTPHYNTNSAHNRSCEASCVAPSPSSLVVSCSLTSCRPPYVHVPPSHQLPAAERACAAFSPVAGHRTCICRLLTSCRPPYVHVPPSHQLPAAVRACADLPTSSLPATVRACEAFSPVAGRRTCMCRLLASSRPPYVHVPHSQQLLPAVRACALAPITIAVKTFSPT